ncbi:MAG: hypothetical protein KAW19_08265 [Candidatus Aminicenantes bacterium]|nr:hypothetical protein [Candidatus Aminicenantes bacterium]
MIEKILLIFLVWGLGWGSGFLTKSYWDRKSQKRNQKKEDRNILIQAIDVLSDFMGEVESGKSKRSSFENFYELDKLRLMIQGKENKDLVDEIQNFVQENRGKDPLSYKPLRDKINSLKSKVKGRLEQKGR